MLPCDSVSLGTLPIKNIMARSQFEITLHNQIVSTNAVINTLSQNTFHIFENQKHIHYFKNSYKGTVWPWKGNYDTNMSKFTHSQHLKG